MQDPRPTPDHPSRDARNPLTRIAMLAALAGITILVGWLVVRAVTDNHVDEQRAVAAREHPTQQTPEAIATLPEPGPVADPEAATAPAAPAAAPEQMGEAFIERFDRDNINDRWAFSDGWSNGPWMANDWRASEVERTPEGLTLHLRPGPADSDYALAGAEIRTHAFYRYGYFELRMKAPRGSGIITGMFTYADRKEGVRPNEIDIEIAGRATRTVELTLHENGRATSEKAYLPFDASDGLHTYGFDWQPGYVRWYVDGRLIHEEAGRAVRNLVRPQQLLISLWASKTLGAWAGDLDLADAPWQLDIACIAYAPAYSGALCG